MKAWKMAHFLKTSAAIGTVELTGFEMMATHALGQYLATPSHRVFTMPVMNAKPQYTKATIVLYMLSSAALLRQVHMLKFEADSKELRPALMLNKSSLVMPGLRGTPAGMTTR